jgi:hypothetical protein
MLALMCGYVSRRDRCLRFGDGSLLASLCERRAACAVAAVICVLITAVLDGNGALLRVFIELNTLR